MRQWSLQSGDPLSLTLASDSRLAPVDYYADQIWELKLGEGEPAALVLQTTYGLRAKSMRLFPRFTLGESSLTDPRNFHHPPILNQIFPNFILLTFSPFPGLDVSMECWVPQSYAIGAHLEITNSGTTDLKLLVEWVGLLSPIEGQCLSPLTIQASTILYGYTSGLSPVIFTTGNSTSGPGPYPSLAQKMDLTPNDVRQFTMIHAGLTDRQDSFELARSVATQNWDAERSHLEMLNAGQLEIYTGDSDWDAAFMLTQKAALSLLVEPPSPQGQTHPGHTSFVLSREPDRGFSSRGDGSDYDHLWNGQTPLDALSLTDLIMPMLPEVAQGLIHNFLATQEENGFIDWKPGLGGQRSRLLATPLLASLAWRIYEANEQISFLEEIYPGLIKFLNTWFTPDHDCDGDGIPEWSHPMQAGLEDHPVYSRWDNRLVSNIPSGVDISTAEGPALCAFLYNECHSLIHIARLIGHDEVISELEQRATQLKAAIENAWDDEASSYFDWDRDTHHSTKGELILESKGSGNHQIQRDFDQPIRLFFAIRTEETARRRPVLFVHGTSASGNPRVERITDEQIRWTPGLGIMTGKLVYASLLKIEIRGLEPDDRIFMHSVGYNHRDYSTLLPLWAGIPSPNRAERLVKESLLEPRRFWHDYGLPTYPDSSQPTDSPRPDDTVVCGCVNLPWNALIGKGLIRYGYQAEAAELVSRLMKAIVQALKHEGAFRRYYHADTGQGVGERNALSGLAPLGLFMETLGVQLISPTRVALSGKNPFPWPITVKYRGLIVMRQKEKTTTIFPDGQTVVIDDPMPRIVSLETTEN